MKDRKAIIVTLTLSLLLPATWCAAEEKPRLPWKETGLTETEAAAHLLDRFAYGPRPGDVERLVDMGLESWLAGQLRGDNARSVAEGAPISVDLGDADLGDADLGDGTPASGTRAARKTRRCANASNAIAATSSA